jgi:hypothetical protein
VVQFHTGGDAMRIDKPASLYRKTDTGENPEPTVTVRMKEEARNCAKVHFCVNEPPREFLLGDNFYARGESS